MNRREQNHEQTSTCTVHITDDGLNVLLHRLSIKIMAFIRMENKNRRKDICWCSNYDYDCKRFFERLFCVAIQMKNTFSLNQVKQTQCNDMMLILCTPFGENGFQMMRWCALYSSAICLWRQRMKLSRVDVTCLSCYQMASSKPIYTLIHSFIHFY